MGQKDNKAIRTQVSYDHPDLPLMLVPLRSNLSIQSVITEWISDQLGGAHLIHLNLCHQAWRGIVSHLQLLFLKENNNKICLYEQYNKYIKKISWFLIQKVIDLLCTFQGHFPSFSTLDETATTNAG